MLCEYFSYYMLEGVEEEAADFDERFGGGSDDARSQIMVCLKTREWPALSAPLRLALLTWLVDRVTLCFTVRAAGEK